jgi:hypothetical protein
MNWGYWADKIVPVIVAALFGAACTFLVTWAAGYLNREPPLDKPMLEWSYSGVTSLQFGSASCSFQVIEVRNVGTATEEKSWIRLSQVPPGCCETQLVAKGVRSIDGPVPDPEVGTVEYVMESMVVGGHVSLFIRVPEDDPFMEDEIEVCGVGCGSAVLETTVTLPEGAT